MKYSERLNKCPKEIKPFIEKLLKQNPKITIKNIDEKGKKELLRSIKSCWIADVKEHLGFPVRPAWNRGRSFKKKKKTNC